MNKTQTIIYLFRQDLRLADNPALTAAIKSGHPVLCCYILDEVSAGRWNMGGASRWWLHHSLSALQTALEQKGGRLILRRGAMDKELTTLIQQSNAAAVYWSRMYEPDAARVEKQLHKLLSAKDITAKRFPGYLLFEPEQIRTGGDTPFKVFTPFWKACLRQPPPGNTLNKPRQIPFYNGRIKSDKLKDWQLLPTQPDWAGGLKESWLPGEAGAHKQLRRFLDQGLQGYKVKRDHPSLPQTSRLSPHLHFGEISPRQIWHAVHAELANNSRLQKDAEHFLSEVGWREFSYHLLHYWPTLPEKPFRPQFAGFPWRKNKKALTAWQQGQTGIPLVDAGMRELWHTGWMHNRVRMIVASFLIKNLLIHWREGEEWFWDTLVDANLANNAASWQWVAGSGADAAPYFRIFNPVTQSEKFDADGIYIKRWVPELQNVNPKHIHAPWTAPAEALKAAGVVLGQHYPQPLTDLKLSRQQALDAYQLIRNAGEN